jgi:hypothetical protein
MKTERMEVLLDWLAEEMAARLSTGGTSLKVARPDEKDAAGGLPPAGTNQAPQPEATGETQDETAGAVDDAWESRVFSATRPDREITAPVSETLPAEVPPDDVPQPQALPDEALLDATPAAGVPRRAYSPLLGRLAVGLLVAVLLINVPLGANGIALARMIPTSVSLVIRNGLLVKEAGSADVYVYENGKFRWITSLEAFMDHGYAWENVRDVEQGFLTGYELGRPVYMLAKCTNSLHVYLLENGFKRWIVDIPTFEAQGYQWSDVRSIGCSDLRNMPTGETIPPGRGPAPQP